MIASFLESWPLFHDVYVAGLLIAALLSLVGVAVVIRDQVFLGAAVSQASLLGIAFGIWLEAHGVGASLGWMSGDTAHSVVGGVFAVAGSLAVAAAAARLRETREALTGWLFLLGASASVLIVANSPHGMAEVSRLLSSSIIGADSVDVGVFAVLLVATLVAVATRRRMLLLLLTDREMARASRIGVAGWDAAIAVWLGLAVAWSIHVAGLVFTFGCLVLPALVAKSLVREAGQLFVLAPVIAVATTLASFVIANDIDLPPGQLAVFLLCALQAGAWAVRR